MDEHEVATPDGRVLKVLEDGDRAGRPVLVHNGMPNSRCCSLLMYEARAGSAFA